MPKLEGTTLTIAVNAALVFAQVAFGAYHVIGKDALNYIDPAIFAFYREIIAGPCLVLIAFVIERAKPDIAKDWWRFILLGSTGVYLNQLLFIEGLALTTATQAAIMQPCIPVFTTAITLIMCIEKFHFLKVLGIISSAAGAVVMVGFNDISFKSQQTRGMFCLLGNTMAMSFYYIFQKPVLKKYPPISVTGWAYIIGSVEMGITSLILNHGGAKTYSIDHRVILPLAYSIIFATVLSYMSLTWANKYAPASVVAAYSSLQPLTAALLSYIFLKQTPEKNEYIGAAAIIVGLAIVTIARVLENKKAEADEQAYQPINRPQPGDDFKRKSFHTSDDFQTLMENEGLASPTSGSGSKERISLKSSGSSPRIGSIGSGSGYSPKIGSGSGSSPKIGSGSGSRERIGSPGYRSGGSCSKLPPV